MSRLGSIDWCCMPYLDSPSCFAEFLDSAKGGKFQLMPAGDFRSEQRYLQRTNVLETLFETPQGSGVIIDWMPLENSQNDSPPVICRQIEIIEGTMNWTLICAPRFNYAKSDTTAEVYREGILFRSTDCDAIATLYSSVPVQRAPDGRSATAHFQLVAGEKAKFTWSFGRMTSHPKFHDPKLTSANWQAWAHRCPDTGCAFAGPWHDSIARSGLTLKLLTSRFSGAIAESITTSVPITVGSAETWDYRYSWIRNSAMMIQALANLGYRQECKDHFSWLMNIVRRDGALGLRSVYTLDGGPLAPERELSHLAGYKNSKPVRISNDSSHSFQLDIYGHILMAAAEYFKIFGELPEDSWPALSEIAEMICHSWRRPDQGPWEVRSQAEHFTVSKIMCWVALDRASWLARVTGQPGSPRWAAEAQILHKTICSQGFDKKQNSFIRSFGSTAIDPLMLLIPLVRFLPIDDPRVQGTIHLIQNQKHQSTSLVASFLLASCFALSGQVDEASDQLAELCSLATPLGFFTEQVDIERGQSSGNIPYAPAHVACINTALYIGMARGRQVPLKRLIGMPDQISAQNHARSSLYGLE